MYRLAMRLKKKYPITSFVVLTIAKIWALVFVVRKILFWKG